MQTLLSKYKTNFIINAYLILTAALIVTGGIFLLATAVHLDIMTAFIVAASTGLGAMVYPIIIFARRFTCLREDINRKIRMIGEGRLDKPLEISREGMFVDIADSVNVANEKLTDRLQSLSKIPIVCRRWKKSYPRFSVRAMHPISTPVTWFAN